MLGCFTELIDAVILTGGLANSKKLTGMVIDYLHNLVKVVVIPGENEMEALAQGGLRILDGREQVHIFRPACALAPGVVEKRSVPDNRYGPFSFGRDGAAHRAAAARGRRSGAGERPSSATSWGSGSR